VGDSDGVEIAWEESGTSPEKGSDPPDSRAISGEKDRTGLLFHQLASSTTSPYHMVAA